MRKRVTLTAVNLTAFHLEAALSHSKMLTTRRTKQRTRKVLAGIAKRAKKQKQQGAGKVGAPAAKPGSD